MSYEIRFEGGLLKAIFSGTVTNSDLSGLADAVAHVEASWAVTPHRMADLRSIERLDIDFTGVFAMAEGRRHARLRNPIKTAIIASDLVHFGFARMFQTLNDHPQIAIAIFRDEDEALQWLQSAELAPPIVH
jgi:hypothetical protein